MFHEITRIEFQNNLSSKIVYWQYTPTIIINYIPALICIIYLGICVFRK